MDEITYKKTIDGKLGVSRIVEETKSKKALLEEEQALVNALTDVRILLLKCEELGVEELKDEGAI